MRYADLEQMALRATSVICSMRGARSLTAREQLRAMVAVLGEASDLTCCLLNPYRSAGLYDRSILPNPVVLCEQLPTQSAASTLGVGGSQSTVREQV